MPKTPMSRDRAWSFVMLNLSVPGWGSYKAGRKFAGIGELIIVFSGLLLLFTWMLGWMNLMVQSELGDVVPPPPAAWLWKWGLICIGISCIWTVVTCISLMRHARAYEAELRKNPPPVLSDLNKPPKL